MVEHAISDPLVVVIAMAAAAMIVLIALVTLRPNAAVHDAEVISKMSREMLVPLQQQLDMQRAQARIDQQMIQSLRLQVIQLGKEPIGIEVAAAQANVPLEVFDVQRNKELRFALIDLFDVSELDILCVDIGLDPQELNGETKTERVVNLIQAARRRDKLDELVAEIKVVRPHAKVNGHG